MHLIALVMIIGMIVFAGVSIAVAVRARKALRGIWREHENLKKEFYSFKNDCFRVNRDVFSQIGRLLHAVETPVPFNAQHGEDFFLMNFFNWKTDGFYVEVGAFDGRVFSNTIAFEAIGWTGILIEAHPVQVEKCRINRPGSQVVHAAVGGYDADGNVTFYQVEGNGTEVLSFLGAEEAHIARCRSAGGRLNTVTVPYRSLSKIFLEQHLDRQIDFMAVDVEGKELDVVRGLDWKKYSPTVVMLENNLANEHKEIAAFMKSLGYELSMRIECNDIYVK